MKLWKVVFVVDTGIDYDKKEAIVIADSESEATSILNRDYKFGYDEFIASANATEIKYDTENHSIIYCSK